MSGAESVQVSVENTGELGRRVTVEVPADRIDNQVDKRIRDLGRKVKLKGFRPGKVPMNVLRQRYGDQVREEVLNDVMRETFQEAVSNENLRPAVTPEITARGRQSGENLEYTAEFEVYPELGDIDVSGLQLERPQVEVQESDVDGMIETLRAQRREWQQVDRGATEGDLVVIQYSAESGDARHPAEGTERAGTVLGSDALFADLEKSLDGVKKDDEKSVSVSFPDDFRVQELAGESGQVHFQVVSVSEGTMPDVDEEFVRSFGISSGDIGEFRKEVRANLERELHQTVMERLRSQVVDGLIRSHENLDLPQKLVEQEAENLQRQAQGGQQDGKPPALSAFMDQARRRVTAGFLLNEIASQNQLQADPGRVRDKIGEIAATYEQPEQVIEAYQNDPRLVENVRSLVLEEQVVEWIVEHAAVTDKPMSFNALMRPGADSQTEAST